jgi:competence protein ComEA
MSWYECSKCGRELDENEVYESRCKKCGIVIVKVCGKTSKPNLNTATALELIRISGFGKQTAACVVAHRNRRKFTSVDELAEVRGVGKKTLEKVKDKVCV